MILSLNFQAKLFITTGVCGFGLAFFYDLIRVLRIAIKHNRLIIGIEDFLYWILVSLIMFFVMLSESFGEVRFFCVCGFFLGMILYFIAVSPLFLKVSETVINIIKKIFKVIFEIIMTPFIIIYKLFRIPAKKTFSVAEKVVKKILHSSKFCVKMYVTGMKKDLRVLQKKKPNGVMKNEKI